MVSMQHVARATVQQTIEDPHGMTPISESTIPLLTTSLSTSIFDVLTCWIGNCWLFVAVWSQWPSLKEDPKISSNFIVTGWDRSFWKTDSWFMPFIIPITYLYCRTWFLCLSLGILGLATSNLGASFWAGTLCSTLGSCDVTLGTRFAGLSWWVLMSWISHCRTAKPSPFHFLLVNHQVYCSSYSTLVPLHMYICQ